jgi:hypothetical protein
MQRPLDELRGIADKYKAPILCGGDVFNHWNSCPELINWAITHLPKMYAIPGQHDLPQHRLEDVRKSAYFTLMEAGVLENLPVGLPLYINEHIAVHGFPWGTELKACEWDKHALNIAVAHQYRWINGFSYAGAPQTSKLSMAKGLTDFDVVIFGDNHKGFLAQVGTKTTVLNCGTLMRRKSDEMVYRPQIGLIYSDGCIVPHLLNIEDEKLDSTKKEPSTAEEVRMDVKEFLEELGGLSQNSLDYIFAIERFIADNRVGEDTKQILTQVLGG